MPHNFNFAILKIHNNYKLLRNKVALNYAILYFFFCVFGISPANIPKSGRNALT